LNRGNRREAGGKLASKPSVLDKAGPAFVTAWLAKCPLPRLLLMIPARTTVAARPLAVPVRPGGCSDFVRGKCDRECSLLRTAPRGLGPVRRSREVTAVAG
jgi:hypothetical protein